MTDAPTWDHPRSRGVYRVSYSHIHITAGSSPLARGLPRACPCCGRWGRIIPARAGFTGAGRLRLLGAGDHPRSRGVYDLRRALDHLTAGSSPLARGLQETQNTDLRVERIIPARAGFTVHHLDGRARARDHPRSRGVYRTGESNPRRRPGSSPLARGLRDMEGARGRTRRIIPARAGFTPHRQRLRRPSQDHPRSRGVYYNASHDPNNEAGSSPLARGLRQAVVDNTGRPGIIPARAGFTRSCPGPSPWRTDHPRSRGVYSTARVRGAVSPGSSPLARGLHGHYARRVHRRRIIPARAGFTHRRARYGLPHQDHPRSRGVYAPVETQRPHRGGSSPLARGLPLSRCSLLLGRRIIPARAGFTTCATRLTAVRGDHPRSRGVYSLTPVCLMVTRGSSPLARGLLTEDWERPERSGIIPARAGFTSLNRKPSCDEADHPRSRGVYCPLTRGSRHRPGSSPLARGLPPTPASGAGRRGIIPARAGFTSRRRG